MTYSRCVRLIFIWMLIAFIFTGCAPLRRLFRMDRRTVDEPGVEVEEEVVFDEYEEIAILPPEDPPVRDYPVDETPVTDDVEVTRPRHAGEESIMEVVYFAFDSSELLPPAKETLKRNAQWLLENPDVRFIIEGHCDERGTELYNIGLGERRAKAVMEYLLLLGIERERMDIVSYGESRPVDPRPTEEAWAKNRRVEFKRIP